MKQRITEIIKELIETYEDSFNISPVGNTQTLNLIFAESISCYRGEEAGKNRKGYIDWDKDKKGDSRPIKTQSGTLDKPTTKQINFLNKNKVKIPKTKNEATFLIKQYIENQNNI